MPPWEYKTIVRERDKLLTDEQLNKIGAYGFELVAVLTITEDITVVGRHETRTNVHYFFKRPRPKSAPSQ